MQNTEQGTQKAEVTEVTESRARVFPSSFCIPCSAIGTPSAVCNGASNYE